MINILIYIYIYIYIYIGRHFTLITYLYINTITVNYFYNKTTIFNILIPIYFNTQLFLNENYYFIKLISI